MYTREDETLRPKTGWSSVSTDVLAQRTLPGVGRVMLNSMRCRVAKLAPRGLV
jgi:hypothetical protein